MLLQLNLDGTTEIRLPDGTKIEFPLGRLSKLSDPFGGGAFVEDPDADLFEDMVMDHGEGYYGHPDDFDDAYQLPGNLDSILAQIADQAGRRPTRRIREEDEDGDVDIVGDGREDTDEDVDVDGDFADAYANEMEFQMRVDMMEYANAIDQKRRKDEDNDEDVDVDGDERMDADEESSRWQRAGMEGMFNLFI